jgi:hypothetical protein
MKNIRLIIASLPPNRRTKVAARARQLIDREMARQRIRKAWRS